MNRKGFVAAAFVLLSLSLEVRVAGQQKDVTNRNADVQATFTDSKYYSGTFTGTAVARVCGQTDPMHFMGKKTLLFEYPQDLPPNQTISDVRFFSDEMVDGKKSSGLFFVSVTLDATNKPKVAWVVDTTELRDKASGLATVASKGGDLILTVKAVNWLGEKLDLLVTCHPPKK